MRLLLQLSIALLVSAARAVITVIQPASLSNIGYIYYNLAKFGEVDYRKKEIYQVVLPQGHLQGCSFLDRPEESKHKIAYLLQDGGCSYSRKSSTAFSSGASLAIVVTSTDKQPDELTIPVPDGKSTKFNSPLIVISKINGDKLREVLERGVVNEQGATEKVPLLLSVDFDSYYMEEKPVVSYWLYTGSHQSIESLLAIESTVRQMYDASLIEFNVYYFLESASSSEGQHIDAKRDCYANGKYCHIGVPGSMKQIKDPRQLIDESVYQRCLWTINRPFFWEYLRKYSRVCLDIMNVDEVIDIPVCRSSVQDAVAAKIQESWKIIERVNKCVTEGFPNPEDKAASNIPVLDYQGKRLTDITGISVIPALVFGDYLARGDSSPTSMLSSICDSFNSPPAAFCGQNLINTSWSDYSGGETSDNGEVFRVLVGASLILTGLGCLFICAYVLKKGLARKELSGLSGLKGDVDRDVQSYMQLAAVKPSIAQRSKAYSDEDF